MNSLREFPIGFFDSGVGGLSVFARLRKLMPNENTIYYGDTVHLPYGNKTKEQLVSYAKNILNFYKTKNVKAVVVACNTSSAQAYELVKDDYEFKIYPIIQSCAKVIANSGLKRVGVFATEATVKAGVYTSELQKYNSNIFVKELARKDWVSIVENKCPNVEEAIANIKYELEEMMEFKPEKIILGCTHYPYLLNELTKYAPASLFIDPAGVFAKFIKDDLEKNQLANSSKERGYEHFYVSSNPDDFIKNAKLFYEISKVPILV